MRTRWRTLLAVAAAAVALAGCSAADQGTSSDQAGVVPAPNKAQPSQGTPQQGQQVTVPQPGTSDRKLARSARLELTTPKVDDVVSQARGLVTGAGGWVGQESSGDTSATLNLSVPADRLDGVLDQLAHLGTLVKREMNTQDVTEQVVDVNSRLDTQRQSVARIRALLDRATSLSDIASIEGELTSRESALESLEQQQKSLAGSVAMATVALTVTNVPAPPPAAAAASPTGFVGGLSAGWDAFLAFGSVFLTVLGALAPFLVVFVPLGWLGWRLYRRRRPVAKIEPVPTES